MSGRFELDPVLQILHCLWDELEANGISSLVVTTVGGHYLTFGENWRYRVGINDTILAVTTTHEVQHSGKPVCKLHFSTDLTVPDSVDKFMVVAQQLVGGESRCVPYDLN